MRDRFAAQMNPLLWLGIIVLAEILILLLFVPNEILKNVVERERAMLTDIFSDESRKNIEQRAGRWYQRLVVAPGIDKALYIAVTPTHRSDAMEDVRSRSGGRSAVLDDRGFFKYLRGRVDAFLLLVYAIIQRIATAASWVPFVLIILVPTVVDGILRWRIRRHGYAFQSPIMHNYAWKAKTAAILAVLFALPLPMALSPVFWPILFSAIAVLIGTSIAFLPKRL